MQFQNHHYHFTKLFLIQILDENDFEFLDEAVFDDEETSYKSLISKKVLALDFSSNSTYIQLGIGGATGWYFILSFFAALLSFIQCYPFYFICNLNLF